MTQTQTTNALRLLQAADALRAKVSGEFSAVHGISVNEFFMLMHLEQAARSRLPRVELSKRMHVSASTVTRMAAPMEKIGLLSRKVDERDARLAFVVLTDTGKERLEEAKATFAKQAGYAFQDRWTEEDLSTLAALLFRLVAGSGANLS